MPLFQDDISVNTLLGPGSFIHGDMKIAGFLRIDGDLDGNLESSGRVIVGEKARIRGNIRSLVITVGGIIQGDIIAPEGITLLSGAVVLGSVYTKKLIVEESVLLSGICFASDSNEKFETTLVDYYNKKALHQTLSNNSWRDA